jgi:glutamate formiminotransferase/formiminotetrahydrofolate cyclodeaminase
MQRRIIECVPNFSEGRDGAVIDGIAAAIRGVQGVKLLHVDAGRDANRTVVTFAGDPDAVAEAAFQAIRQAALTIDMRRHSGEHPRMGATDVCPLIPVSGVTIEEAVQYARRLAERVARELANPVYLYEHAATAPERRSLAAVRAGQYEGLEARMKDARWKPDYGEAAFNPRSGATAIGVRDFLVAYNVNLNTTSVSHARAVAADVRETGRIARKDGKVVCDEQGRPLRVPGMLRSVRAIGWYMRAYGIAQVSMNLTDLHTTPVHEAFEACRQSAARHGLRVTGSELVGLIPLAALLEAGRYFLDKQHRSSGLSQEELVKIAVRSLGLDELAPFDAEAKILERVLANLEQQDTGGKEASLLSRDLPSFTAAVASEQAVPGAAAVNACTGALAASLAAMVANMAAAAGSAPPGVQDGGDTGQWRDFSMLAGRGQQLRERLLGLVEEDNAFDILMNVLAREAAGAPGAALTDSVERRAALSLDIMQAALETFTLVEELLAKQTAAWAAELGSAVLCAHPTVHGAFLRLRVMAAATPDPAAVLGAGERLLSRSLERQRQLLATVEALAGTLNR